MHTREGQQENEAKIERAQAYQIRKHGDILISAPQAITDRSKPAR
jgi:hypothetical protein